MRTSGLFSLQLWKTLAACKLGVGFHAHFGHVEAHDFLFFADPDAHRRFQDHPYDAGGDYGEDPDHCDRVQLDHQGRFRVCDDHRNGPPDPCKEVYRDGANNVVDLELVEHGNCEDHDHTTDGTDQSCRTQVMGSAARL